MLKRNRRRRAPIQEEHDNLYSLELHHQERSLAYCRLLEEVAQKPTHGTGLLIRSRPGSASPNQRSEAELKWACTRMPTSKNLRVDSNGISRQLTRQQTRVVSMPVSLGGSRSASGGIGFISNHEFRSQPLSQSMPSLSSSPQYRTMPILQPLRLRPEMQNFIELTSGVPLEERVRWIPCVEHRGIMVKQLELLMDFITKRTNPSTNVIQGWVDSSTGEQLCLNTLSLLQVEHWVIKPMTRAVKCSYAEAIAISETSQKPTWFVSHWTGSPTLEMVAGIKKHSMTRYPQLCSVTGAYWICAFALNQHQSAPSDINAFIEDQCFFKAMCECRGVLLVLDSLGPAMAFRRLWCCFEMIVAVQNLNHLLLDIESPDAHGEPQVLTDGLTDGEAARLASGDAELPTGWTMKMEREASFPIERIRDGLSLDVKDLKAYTASDRMSIMKALAGKDGQPKWNLFEDDPMYDTVSKRLRAKVANLALRQLMNQGKDSSELGDELSRAMAENPDSEGFDLNLSSGKLTTASLTFLSHCIPTNAKRVAINFGHCYKMNSVSTILNAFSSMDNLQDLSLSFENCTGLKSVEELVDFGKVLNQAQGLKAVKMNFTGCDKLGALDTFVQEMKRANIPSLQILDQTGTDQAEEEEVVVEVRKPKGKARSPIKWVSETAKFWARRDSVQK